MFFLKLNTILGKNVFLYSQTTSCIRGTINKRQFVYKIGCFYFFVGHFFRLFYVSLDKGTC